MTSKEFVRNFYLEKANLLNLCFEDSNAYDVAKLISNLQLDPQKKKYLNKY